MPSGGNPLSQFTDFMALTGPTYLTGPKDLINLAQKQTYLLSRFLKGRGIDEVIQGGNAIKDDVLVSDGNTYTTYQPGDTHTWLNPQVTKEISVGWRFALDYMSWTKQEIALSIPSGLSRSARHQVYKDLKRTKEQRMTTSMLNGMDSALLRPAAGASNATQMEGSGGRQQYSIWAFITEDGLAPSGWTTIEGQNPSTLDVWRNQVEDYDVDALDDRETGLFRAFDNMWMKLKYVPPKMQAEYFEKDELNRQMILASRLGVNQYRSLLRDSNDRLVSPQDPSYSTPVYSGIPIEYVSELDTALYTADGKTEADATGTNPGARYVFPNGNYLKPVFHGQCYFEKLEPREHPNVLNTFIQPVETWWNLFCRSRKHLGIIIPS